MRHSCGQCGSHYGCNGGLGSPCNCGHAELAREARRCLPCRERALLGAVGVQRGDLDAAIPIGGPPMYRFVQNLQNPFAEVAQQPDPVRIDWANIPRDQRCRCNKCSREAQARGIAI